jgi:hypothetical protein
MIFISNSKKLGNFPGATLTRRVTSSAGSEMYLKKRTTESQFPVGKKHTSNNQHDFNFYILMLNNKYARLPVSIQENVSLFDATLFRAPLHRNII